MKGWYRIFSPSKPLGLLVPQDWLAPDIFDGTRTVHSRCPTCDRKVVLKPEDAGMLTDEDRTYLEEPA